MKSDSTSKQFVDLRIKEMFEEAMLKERDDFIEKLILELNEAKH